MRQGRNQGFPYVNCFFAGAVLSAYTTAYLVSHSQPVYCRFYKMFQLYIKIQFDSPLTTINKVSIV